MTGGIDIWTWLPRLATLAVLAVYGYFLLVFAAIAVALGDIIGQLIGAGVLFGGIALAWVVFRKIPFLRQLW